MPYTWPLIVSQRFYDGSVESGMATLVVVNSDGWILTAAHVLVPGTVAQVHEAEIAAYEAAKGKKGGRAKKNNKWITNVSYWWGRDGVQVQDVKYNQAIDLAVGRLVPFDPHWVSRYPVFKDPSTRGAVGTSLCRLGFPFHSISASFDANALSFSLAPGSLPAPFFPIEGIMTREALGGSTDDGFPIKFIETSSPGLRGQSGGPVFDTSGVVWGIQSRTSHLALGFTAIVEVNKRKVEEQQFLNVGLAAHFETIHAFLERFGVPHTLGAAQ